MRLLRYLTILASSILLFTSCIHNKPKVIYKTKVIYQTCPYIEIPDKPKALDYKFIVLQYDNDIYYCLDEVNAKALATNWIEYKSYCETLKKQVDNYNKSISNEKNK